MSGWELVRARARLADTAVTALAVLLATACLIPLFQDLQWLLPAMVMITVIAVIGAGSRALAMPVPFVPVVQGLGLVITLTVMFAAEQAWARILPTSPAWDALRTLVQQGLLDADRYSAPVPTWPGVTLLAVGGVGLVALSTDTFFVSVRMPALAGVPLLALYLAPALVLADAGPWWGVALPATGWLLILAADQRDRVREWGALAATTRIRGLSTGARRIGVLAIAVASVVGVVVPMNTSAPFRTGAGSGGTGASSGGDPSLILDPLASMRRSILTPTDTQVLEYRTQAKEPSYLRVSVLEDFDGTTWLPRAGLANGLDRGVPLPGEVLSAAIALDATNRVTGGDSYTYDVTVTNLANTYLPLPYPVSEVSDLSGLGTGWRLDPTTGMAFSANTPATGRTYRVAALDPRIQSDQLRGASAPTGALEPLLALPDGMSPRIADIAAQVTADARTPYDKAMALQRWFTRDGGFTYSTSVPSGASADYIAEFLDQRVGYCEQFAGAMAVMARTLGIPSRVVIGFTQGSRDDEGTWRVTARDAHAWPELWFDGVGWARFEPTPRSGGTVLTPAYARSPDAADGSDAGSIQRRTFDDGLDATAVPSQQGRSNPWGWLLIAAVALGLVALGLPMIGRVVRRRRRMHGRGAVVEGAWAEIGDLAVDFGQPWAPSRTPRQAAERLSRGMPEQAAEALRRVREEVERVRYARDGSGTMSAEHAEAIRADVRIVARHLRERVRWQTRVAAYCWPSSERRRQRSSMRSMNPGEAGGLGADGPAGASVSAGRVPNAE